MDVIAIDAVVRSEADADRRGGLDLLEESLSTRGREPLAVVDAVGDSVWVENDCSRDHRARDRAASDLVAASHVMEALAMSFMFEIEGRFEDLHS